MNTDSMTLMQLKNDTWKVYFLKYFHYDKKVLPIPLLLIDAKFVLNFCKKANFFKIDTVSKLPSFSYNTNT